MEVNLIAAADIDRLKWDSCVHYATQPSFAGYTWYLNAVSRDWVGLVEGDYETVLPLFFDQDWLKRRRHRQPAHLAPSGPYSQHVLSRPRVLALLKSLPPRTCDLLLAWEGQVGLEGLHSAAEGRWLLQLYEPYETLAAGFRPSSASPAREWHYGNPTPEQLTTFWKTHSASYRGREQDLHRYHRIMYQAMHRGQMLTTSLGDSPEEPLAMACFITSHGYLFRLLSVARRGPLGENALQALYQGMIETYAGRPLVLDFNGDPCGEAFGATRLQYTRLSNV